MAAATVNDTLAKALLAAQRDMPAIEKDGVNPHFKSRYMTLDHLLAKALPVLRKHGLLVTQWPTSLDGREALRTRVDHVDSGEFLEDVMLLAMAKPGPQEQGSCITYAKRYALGALLCISTEEDDDAEVASKDAAAGGAASSSPGEGEEERLTASLLAAAEQLNVKDQTVEFVEKSKASRSPAEHVAWLRKQLATAEQNLASEAP